MKLPRHPAILAAAASLALLGACDPGATAGGGSGTAGTSASLETVDQQASYGIGRNMARSLTPAADRLDLDALMMGVRDVLEERDARIPEDSLQSLLQRFAQEVQQAQQEERSRQAEENMAAGEEFLAENAQREGVQTTESGLQYEVIEEGDGPTPGPEDRVRVHYTGTLLDGTEFDSSRGGEPAVFTAGGVIQGFGEGIQMMPVGSTYRFWIPSGLAYGPAGAGLDIPPNATLVFEVELLGIE